MPPRGYLFLFPPPYPHFPKKSGSGITFSTTTGLFSLFHLASAAAWEEEEEDVNPGEKCFSPFLVLSARGGGGGGCSIFVVIREFLRRAPTKIFPSVVAFLPARVKGERES